VYSNKYSKRLSYKKLLYFLYNTDFTYTIELDANRYEDGTDLRYRFGYDTGFSSAVIADCIDIFPCSVLEMLIALSIRLEDHIMSDPDAGDRTAKWFWDMIVNLGLGSMDDSKFNETEANYIVQRFLNREYEPNGKGGLFTLEHCDEDLRNVEIWYQACWYLDKVLYGGYNDEQ
jgi:hypothetical protein